MRKLLFTLALLTVVAVPCKAAVTVEHATDVEYLINSGYSQAVAEDVFMQKTRARGEAIEPLYEKNENKFVRGWRKVFTYIDPAQENYDKIHHDTKLSPHYSDL